MDEIIFDNDDYFLPNGDEESIWQIMDTIIIEKNDNEPNKRTISEISNNNHHINQNNNIPIKKENINAKKLKAEIEIPKSVLETNNDEVIFFSNTKDPFAQTVWMVLLEKKIPFKYIEVTTNKVPDWFLKLNPEGSKSKRVLKKYKYLRREASPNLLKKTTLITS
eukprot:TRINITY_DN3025_c0_g1_i2.p1 TRINITY_DN3025_c0_g1~~TRINITY_DN3025_c0_g1_i2.p1  ORF type:complete len:165 (-),score=33.77 TRINITY_DN3025_c0_g1_i2:56-550(-)